MRTGFPPTWVWLENKEPEHKQEATWFDELALQVGLLILPIATKIVTWLLNITIFISECLEKL